MNITLNPSPENARRLSQKSLPPLPSISEVSPLPILKVGSREATGEKSGFIKKWPQRPQNLHRGGILAALSCTGDAFTIIISCVFFVYGAFVISYNGVATSSVPHLSLLQNAARYGPTVFPILFAAIVGQAMHAIALWRLELGERMKVLDQLLGSTSIFATVVTQLKFRNIGFVGAGLIILWALSPIGGQASLRVLDFSTASTTQPQTMQYLDMNSTFEPADMGAIGELDAESAIFTGQALYGASLLSPLSTKVSAMDTWGNVKIPMIERLSNLTQDSEGWYEVGGGNATVFSSLIGIPTSNLIAEINSTFNMETSYWVLDCPVLQRPASGFAIAPGINTSSQQSIPGWASGWSQSWSFSTPDVYHNASDTNITSRKLYYTSYDDDQKMTYAECTMNTTYVEVQSACTGKVCAVTKIRSSTKPHPVPAYTLLYNFILVEYVQDFFKAVAGNMYTPTPVQRYFVNPGSPFNNTPDGMLLYTVGSTSFATSFAQLMNTFWIAGIGLSVIPGGLAGNAKLHNGTNTLTMVATVSTSREILICKRFWLAMLFVATGSMFIAGVFGLVLEFTRRAPDLAMNISSLTRDNPYIHLPPGGSTLDSVERSRLMQDVRVRFGDVAAGHKVGYIAIASCDNEQEVGKLRGEKKARFYS